MHSARRPYDERDGREARPLRPPDVLALQSQAGNAAVGRMLSRQAGTEAPPAQAPGGAGADVQRELARQFLEMGMDAVSRAFPNIMTAGSLQSGPMLGGMDHGAPFRAQALADVALAKTMLGQAAQMRGAVGLGLGATGAGDADRRIDMTLMQLDLVVLPILVTALGAGPGYGPLLMQMGQQAFQLVTELRMHMALAGLPVPPPPAAPPPGPAGPRAE